MLEQGRTLERIIEECEDRGIELPQKIQNAPKLLVGLDIYWIGFTRLNSSRASGWGPSELPWMLIEEYCDRVGIFGDQREIFHSHIYAMDKAYLEYCEEHKGG